MSPPNVVTLLLCIGKVIFTRVCWRRFYKAHYLGFECEADYPLRKRRTDTLEKLGVLTPCSFRGAQESSSSQSQYKDVVTARNVGGSRTHGSVLCRQPTGPPGNVVPEGRVQELLDSHQVESSHVSSRSPPAGAETAERATPRATRLGRLLSYSLASNGVLTSPRSA